MKRTVLITGSTSGIGKAIAIAFAKLGHSIIFHGLEEDGAEIAANIAKEYSIQYLFSNANVLYPEQIETLVRQANQTFGGIDILVNNAGIQHVAPLDEFPIEKWNAILGINLTAPFLLSKLCWSWMKQNQFGRIIHIASAHGMVASEHKSAYVASKHGLLGLTKTIALEGAPYNITCNAVCPGFVHTPIIDKQLASLQEIHHMSKEEVIENVLLQKQAVKKFISAELIANAVLFLAQEQADAITGIALPVEGGWIAQ